MNFLELVAKSRSYRGYDPDRRLTREELERFVACARLAPSSVNRQPLKYYLAWEEEQAAAIQPLTGWAAALREHRLPHPGHCPPAFIVICQDTALAPETDRYLKDVGIVAQTMLLAAAEQGLGGCMIGSFPQRKLAEVLHLPEGVLPMLVVAFGKPDETVVLTDAEPDGSVTYYRDENDVHYVPKRRLEDLILN